MNRTIAPGDPAGFTYSALAAYYLVIGQLPDAVFAWFALLEVLFTVGFVRFLMATAARVPR